MNRGRRGRSYKSKDEMGNAAVGGIVNSNAFNGPITTLPSAKEIRSGSLRSAPNGSLIVGDVVIITIQSNYFEVIEPEDK